MVPKRGDQAMRQNWALAGVFGAVLLAITTPCRGWETGTFKDSFRDRIETFADGSRLNRMVLRVECVSNRLMPTIRFDEPVSYAGGLVSISYRWDDGPVIEYTAAGFSTNMRSLLFANHALDRPMTNVRKAKRLRIVVVGQVLDFEINQNPPLPEIKCK